MVRYRLMSGGIINIYLEMVLCGERLTTVKVGEGGVID